jgi:hypothetical protein
MYFVGIPSLETVDRSVLSTELEELLGHVWVQRSAHHVFLRQGPELSNSSPTLLLLKYDYYYFERVCISTVNRAVFQIRETCYFTTDPDPWIRTQNYGSRSCSFRKWLSRNQQSIFFKVFLLFTFLGTFISVFKDGKSL